MQAHDLIGLLSLPEQRIKKLSFCASYKAQRVAEWASLLRPTQVEKTSAMLYAALPELNQLRCNASIRFEMLETLRPYVQNTIFGLSKSFINQAMPLSDAAHKSAIIAQSLQKHMADGYCLVIRDLVSKKVKGKNLETLSTALHRAITGFGLIHLRGLQIYTGTPLKLWRTMHLLFRIADLYELTDKQVNDDVQRKSKLSSIQHCYFRSVLLATAHPDQLPQNDIAALYDHFGEWASQLKFNLDLSDNPDFFLYINLDTDSGPQYKSRAQSSEKHQLVLELDLRALAAQLAKQDREADSERPSNNSLAISTEISQALLKHLLDCWGGIAQRRHDRRSIQMTADVCIGLNDCHYFANNARSFDAFIKVNSGADELDNDNTTLGFTPKDTFTPAEQSADRPLHRLEIQNVSQGGYCLLWKGVEPLKIQAGEMIGLREFGKRIWQIGVVRWIRLRRNSSQFGIQILSDTVEPYGLAQTYDMGGYSDYMRALHIPSHQFSNQTESLLTSSAPFQAGDRVKMIDGSLTSVVKLEECVFSTASVQQFKYKILEQSPNKSPKAQSGSQW